jgi:GT2 family glycosyltransferase
MLGIVIVVYKSHEETVRFVEEEIPKISIPYKAAIVNVAASEEESFKLAKACRADLVLHNKPVNNQANLFIISKTENLGYAKGNNIGVSFLHSNFTITYLLFSNNDLKISSKETVFTLVDKLKSVNEIGFIGPKVIGPDGEDQSPQTEIGFLRYFAWNAFPFLRGKTILSIRLFNNIDTDIPGRFCYCVSGCFFVARADSFMKVGLFDENTFLFGEEKILAERMKTIGKYAYYIDNVSVNHFGGGTTSQHLTSKWIEQEVFKSDCYYYIKYKNISPLFIKLLKFVRKIYRCKIIQVHSYENHK